MSTQDAKESLETPALFQSEINSNSEECHTVFAKRYINIPKAETHLSTNAHETAYCVIYEKLNWAQDCVQPR